ncbi:MAG: hypothetical protein ACKOXB_07305 [Flavobacteriales bacterium]
MRKIKMIWDFRGPDSEGIAKHHKIHLGEFAERAKLSFFSTGVEGEQQHWMAFIVVEEKDMKMVRDALRPHRGVLAD